MKTAIIVIAVLAVLAIIGALFIAAVLFELTALLSENTIRYEDSDDTDTE